MANRKKEVYKVKSMAEGDGRISILNWHWAKYAQKETKLAELGC